jgi:hypothetical protein
MSTQPPREFWAVVHPDDHCPVTPFDGNDHDDQGMLVYFSQEAAEAAAKYQNEHYDINSIAVPLSELKWVPTKPGKRILGSRRSA